MKLIQKYRIRLVSFLKHCECDFIFFLKKQKNLSQLFVGKIVTHSNMTLKRTKYLFSFCMLIFFLFYNHCETPDKKDKPIFDRNPSYGAEPVSCTDHLDKNPRFIPENITSTKHSDIYDIANVFLLFEYLVGNIFEAMKDENNNEKLSEFSKTIEQFEILYKQTEIVLQETRNNKKYSQYKNSLIHFERAAIHMQVFWRDLRSAIQLNDPERLRTAYDEFIKYKASILLAVINTPEIEVNSLATNSDILIDPNEPEYGYISISLLDSDRKLITTKVRNEDYTIKLDTSSLAATVTDVQSKPKLSNEQRVIFLLSDVSGSMSSTDPTRKRVAAAKKIVDALGPDDFLMLATFGMSHKPTFTSFHGSGTGGSKDCLDYLIDTNFSKAVGSTPLYASIGESIAMIDDLRQKLSGDQTPITYSIIVLTDGQNTYNGSSNDPELYKAISNPVVVAYLAKKLSIPVYTIGLSDGVDNNILKAIASSTNGLFGTTLSASGLDEIFSNYSRALEGQTFLKIKFNKNANSLRGRSARIIVSNKNNIKETNVNIR